MGFLTVSLLIEVLQSTHILVTEAVLGRAYVIGAGLMIIIVVLARGPGTAVMWQRVARTTSVKQQAKSWSILLILLLVLSAIAGFVVYSAIYSSLQAWDVFGSWAFHALQLINGGFQSGDYAGYGHNQSHPSSATTLLAWGAWYASHNQMPWALLWALAWLACGIIVGGYGLANQLSVKELMPVIYASLTIPLFEAHAIGVGSSEIWLSLTMLGGTAALLAGIKQRNPRMIVFGFFTFAMMVFTRKTGAAHLIITLIALTSTYIVLSKRVSENRFFSFALIGFVGTAIIGGLVVFDVFAIYTTGGAIEMRFAGRNMVLQAGSAMAVIYNEIYSKIFMQSFSLVFLALLLGCVTIIANYRNRGSDCCVYAVAIFMANWAVFLLGQYFSLDVFRLAQPGNDTSISRALVGVAPISMLIVIETIATIKKNKSYSFS